MVNGLTIQENTKNGIRYRNNFLIYAGERLTLHSNHYETYSENLIERLGNAQTPLIEKPY